MTSASKNNNITLLQTVCGPQSCDECCQFIVTWGQFPVAESCDSAASSLWD